MSAYGTIERASPNTDLLPPTGWLSGSGSDATANREIITVHHLRLDDARKHAGLIEYLHSVFNLVVEDGMTYPQEKTLDVHAFAAYFIAADFLLGIRSDDSNPNKRNAGSGNLDAPASSFTDGERITPDPLAHLSGTVDVDWSELVAGFYYVKPNYPGRSSHVCAICNAGFVVPTINRRKGYGSALARSYLHYAPKFGYEASVFNLVYVNNVASIKLWETLGFTKAGLIPRAGRLKRRDGEGEEFLDAYVFYKRFE